MRQLRTTQVLFPFGLHKISEQQPHRLTNQFDEEVPKNCTSLSVHFSVPPKLESIPIDSSVKMTTFTAEKKQVYNLEQILTRLNFIKAQSSRELRCAALNDSSMSL